MVWFGLVWSAWPKTAVNRSKLLKIVAHDLGIDGHVVGHGLVWFGLVWFGMVGYGLKWLKMAQNCCPWLGHGWACS